MIFNPVKVRLSKFGLFERSLYCHLGYLTIKDLELALAKLLTDDSKNTFKKLDEDFSGAAVGHEIEGRVESADAQSNLKWSLSKWSQLQQPLVNSVLETDQGQVSDLNQSQQQEKQPVEIANLKTLFPSFYANLPDSRLNK